MKPPNLFHVAARLTDSNERTFGSGYAVGDRLIITALHIVTNRTTEAVANPGSVTGVTVSQFLANGKKAPHHELPVECVAASDVCDVALLRLRKGYEFRERCETPDAATVDHTLVNLGCGATGFPEIVRGEEPNSYSFDGIFMARNYMGDPHRAIRLMGSNVRKVNHWRGMSGAAVFAAGTDTMLGVVVSASEKFRGKEVRFAVLCDFVDELMSRNDGQADFLPDSWKPELRLFEQDAFRNTQLADLRHHLYTLDYAWQVEVASRELGDGDRIAGPVFMIVQGLRDDRLEYVVPRIVEDVFKGHRQDRSPESVDAWSKEGREEPVEVKIRASRGGGLKDMEQVRAKFLEALNVSDRKLTGGSFVDRARELIGLGDGPRVFYSRLSMFSFENRAKNALVDWMEDWEEIAKGLPSCSLAYFFLLERDLIQEFEDERGRLISFLFAPVLRWCEKRRMDVCRYTIQGVQEARCIDLGNVEPVPWDRDIQDWIESELLEARLGCSREELSVLLQKASRALDVLNNSKFRLNEIRDRFLIYEPA